MDISLIELIGYFVMGYLMHRLISAWITVNQLKSILENEKNRHDTKENILIVQLEKIVQNEYTTILVYDQNNKFLGQADTMDDVEIFMRKKYPDLKFSGIISVDKY